MKCIYVINQDGKSLMPTKRLGMVSRWLTSTKDKPVAIKKVKYMFHINSVYQTEGELRHSSSD